MPEPSCTLCTTPLVYGPQQRLAVCGDYVLPAWITGTWTRVAVCAPCFAVAQSLTAAEARSFAQVQAVVAPARHGGRPPRRADWTVDTIAQAVQAWIAAHGGQVPMVTDYRKHDLGLPTLTSLYLATQTGKLAAAYAVLEAHGVPVFTAYQAQRYTRYAANGRRGKAQSMRKTTHRQEA